jgi:Leucine-rich repeat (LRR) protein
LCFLLTTFACAFPNISPNLPSWEIEALSDLYTSTQGPHWHWNVSKQGIHWDFAGNPNPCADDWSGLKCSPVVNVDGVDYLFVVALALPAHGLNGTLPESIGYLAQLEVLYLAFNLLHGPLPESIGSLTNLKVLNITENFWTGALPNSIGNLVNLEVLDVSALVLDKFVLVKLLSANVGLTSNYGFNGSLPSTMTNLQQLRECSVGFNMLTGAPTVFGALPNLEVLYLSMNRFHGSIPDELQALRRLQVFSIGVNQFTNSDSAFEVLRNNVNLTTFVADYNLFNGTIPSYVGERTNLTLFDVSYNYMHGTLPDTMQHLTQLQLFDIANNSFSGTFPWYVVNMPNLTWVDFDNCTFRGSLPAGLTKLLTLQFFTMENNSLTGTLPADLGSLTEMMHFNLGRNKLHGTLPASIGAWSYTYLLDVGGNQLTGSIPESVGQLYSLLSLNLSSNRFTGVIPVSLCDLPGLSGADLSYNRLHGSIPEAVGNVPTLTSLYVQSNNLVGSIPKSVSTLAKLQALMVQDNALTGPLDGVFNASLQRDLSILQLGNNQLTGQFPDEVFALPALQTLVALVNCFHGTLPRTVCGATQLLNLAMDGLQSATTCQRKILPGVSDSYYTQRRMHGGIHDCVFELPHLEALHLSGNGFKGTIPDDVTISESLVSLALSNNNLWGPIPAAFQMKQWALFDLSFNFLDGELHSEFGRVNESASVSLQTNRLSGRVPASLVAAQDVNVLDGNLFSCELNKNQLPDADASKTRYVCGSNAFDASYYLWLGAAAVACGVVLILWYRKEILPGVSIAEASACLRRFYDFPMNPTALAAAELSPAKQGAAASAAAPQLKDQRDSDASVGSLATVESGNASLLTLEQRLVNFKYICQVTTILCHGTMCCAAAACVLLVYYPNVASEYRTHQHTYAYRASAAYVSGVAPFVTEFVLFVAFLVFVLLCYCYMLTRFEQTEGAVLSRTHDMFTMGQRRIEHLTKHKVLVYGAYFTVNFIVVLGVNILFIYLSLYAGSRVVIAAQILMSLFKLLWNNMLTLYAALYFVERNEEGIDVAQASLSRVFYMQLFVMLLNNIAIPCLVVAAISPNCFYNVFIPPPAVEASYVTQQCTGVVFQDGCNIYNARTTTLTYDPPFNYSYQCSGSFVKNYAPSFVYMCFTATFAVPLLQELAARCHRNLAPGSPLSLRLNDMLQYPVLQRRDPNSRESLAATFRTRMYFNANQLLLNQLTFIGILLTFGVVFPPLAVALALTVCFVILYSRLKVGQFLITCVQLNHLAYLDKINGECTRVVSLPMLRKALWMLVSFACCFYALFLFDALGDVEGFGAAYWVLIVLPLMPVVLYAAFDVAKTVYLRSCAGDKLAEAAEGDGGIVLNPVASTVPVVGVQEHA